MWENENVRWEEFLCGGFFLRGSFVGGRKCGVNNPQSIHYPVRFFQTMCSTRSLYNEIKHVTKLHQDKKDQLPSENQFSFPMSLLITS